MRTAVATASVQDAPTTAAEAVWPRCGPSASVRNTAAAAGESQATESHDGPGSASPTAMATGTALTRTPHVRSRSSRSVEYGVVSTSSDDGSPSPEKETETPSSGASGAMTRKAAVPISCEASFASSAKSVALTTPSSQAPRSAGTAASSRVVPSETPSRRRRRSTSAGAGRSTSSRTRDQTSSSSSADDSRATVPRQSGQVIRWVSTEAPSTGSTVPSTNAASVDSSLCQGRAEGTVMSAPPGVASGHGPGGSSPCPGGCAAGPRPPWW